MSRRSPYTDWSGRQWYERPDGYRPTIMVIDQPSETYREYHERQLREEGAKRVPFGFSRVLVEDQEPDDDA